MSEFRFLSRAFIAAVFLAAATVLEDPRDFQNWSTAAGIVAAAVSGGARKRQPTDRTRENDG